MDCATARARVRAAGLEDRVDIRLTDYRNVEDRFDRIVSVGMFGHVGPLHYREYFTTLHRLLGADGVALVHTIGRLARPRPTSPWITRHIFPGGYIPALSEITGAVGRADLLPADLEVLHTHYADTLRAWYDRFMARADKAEALYDARFVRMWRYYLLASEAAHYRSKGKTSGEYVMQSIMNSVPNLPQSVVIMESTPNGAQGVFYQTWQAAADFEDFKAGRQGNGYIRVFAPWFEFDDSAAEITPEEAEHLMADLDSASQYAGERELVERYQVPPAKLKWRRQVIDSPACNGDARKFLQEYPTDAITCFLQSGQNRFDPEGMASIASAITLAPEPRYGILEQPSGAAAPTFIETSKAEAWLRVWETPHENMRYIGAADFMTGEQSIASRRETDCHAWGIGRATHTDKDKVEHPALLAAAGLPDDRTKDLDIVAERIALTARWYGNCLIAPEVNNLHGMIELLRRHQCNVWNRKKAGAGKTVLIPGFQTTTSSKRQVVGELAALIREQELDLRCSRALAELRNFVTHPDGTEAAGDGWHDDWVMMLAILAHVLPAAAPMESPEAKLTREQRRISHYAARQLTSSAAECS